MTANVEFVVMIPLVCELVPVNMTLRELESLSYNNYMSTTVFLLMSKNVCLRTNNGLSVGDFDNTETHRIFGSICTCFIIVLISFIVLCWYFA